MANIRACQWDCFSLNSIFFSFQFITTAFCWFFFQVMFTNSFFSLHKIDFYFKFRCYSYRSLFFQTIELKQFAKIIYQHLTSSNHIFWKHRTNTPLDYLSVRLVCKYTNKQEKKVAREIDKDDCGKLLKSNCSQHTISLSRAFRSGFHVNNEQFTAILKTKIDKLGYLLLIVVYFVCLLSFYCN